MSNIKTPASPETPADKPATVTPDNFQTLLDAGCAASEIKAIGFNQTALPVAIIPHGYKIETMPLARMEQWAGKPQRKKGTFRLGDTESFIRYFNEHKSDDSRVFAAVGDTGATFTGILNFHGAIPSFNDHTCELRLVPTHEWNTWIVNAKRQMTQVAFAGFLEDNASMFVDPRGADLLELVTTLEGKAHVDINQAVKLQSGAINLRFTETVELKGGSGSSAGEITVPTIFTVEIAPFEGTHSVAMKARLRFRIENKKIIFWYEPIDAHLHVREIVASVAEAIESQTDRQPLKVGPDGLTLGEDND